MKRLRAEGFQPYWHQRVPPNDGGISLGQAVLAAMLPFFREKFGNASSRHEFGTVARKALDSAREQVAAALMLLKREGELAYEIGFAEAGNAGEPEAIVL